MTFSFWLLIIWVFAAAFSLRNYIIMRRALKIYRESSDAWEKIAGKYRDELQNQGTRPMVTVPDEIMATIKKLTRENSQYIDLISRQDATLMNLKTLLHKSQALNRRMIGRK